MSKIALTPNASGTGVFSILSPATNTNRSLTLPDEAGTVLINGTTSNVGIGTTAPQKLLHLQASGGSTARFQSTGVRVWDIGNNSTSFVFYDSTAAAERMRIDSSGNLLVGKASGSTDSYLQIAGSGSKTSLRLENNYGSGSVCLINNQGNSTFNAFIFENGGSAKGSIVVTTSATSYNTSSDYRLKTDAQPMTGASARVQALKPVNFEWISSGNCP
jgi:hypothetical protein